MPPTNEKTGRTTNQKWTDALNFTMGQLTEYVENRDKQKSFNSSYDRFREASVKAKPEDNAEKNLNIVARALFAVAIPEEAHYAFYMANNQKKKRHTITGVGAATPRNKFSAQTDVLSAISSLRSTMKSSTKVPVSPMLKELDSMGLLIFPPTYSDDDAYDKQKYFVAALGDLMAGTQEYTKKQESVPVEFNPEKVNGTKKGSSTTPRRFVRIIRTAKPLWTPAGYNGVYRELTPAIARSANAYMLGDMRSAWVEHPSGELEGSFLCRAHHQRGRRGNVVIKSIDILSEVLNHTDKGVHLFKKTFMTPLAVGKHLHTNIKNRCESVVKQTGLNGLLEAIEVKRKSLFSSSRPADVQRRDDLTALYIYVVNLAFTTQFAIQLLRFKDESDEATKHAENQLRDNDNFTKLTSKPLIDATTSGMVYCAADISPWVWNAQGEGKGKVEAFFVSTGLHDILVGDEENENRENLARIVGKTPKTRTLSELMWALQNAGALPSMHGMHQDLGSVLEGVLEPTVQLETDSEEEEDQGAGPPASPMSVSGPTSSSEENSESGSESGSGSEAGQGANPQRKRKASNEKKAKPDKSAKHCSSCKNKLSRKLLLAAIPEISPRKTVLLNLDFIQFKPKSGGDNRPLGLSAASMRLLLGGFMQSRVTQNAQNAMVLRDQRGDGVPDDNTRLVLFPWLYAGFGWHLLIGAVSGSAGMQWYLVAPTWPARDDDSIEKPTVAEVEIMKRMQKDGVIKNSPLEVHASGGDVRIVTDTNEIVFDIPDTTTQWHSGILVAFIAQHIINGDDTANLFQDDNETHIGTTWNGMMHSLRASLADLTDENFEFREIEREATSSVPDLPGLVHALRTAVADMDDMDDMIAAEGFDELFPKIRTTQNAKDALESAVRTQTQTVREQFTEMLEKNMANLTAKRKTIDSLQAKRVKSTADLETIDSLQGKSDEPTAVPQRSSSTSFPLEELDKARFLTIRQQVDYDIERVQALLQNAELVRSDPITENTIKRAENSLGTAMTRLEDLEAVELAKLDAIEAELDTLM